MPTAKACLCYPLLAQESYRSKTASTSSRRILPKPSDHKPNCTRIKKGLITSLFFCGPLMGHSPRLASIPRPPRAPSGDWAPIWGRTCNTNYICPKPVCPPNAVAYPKLEFLLKPDLKLGFGIERLHSLGPIKKLEFLLNTDPKPIFGID